MNEHADNIIGLYRRHADAFATRRGKTLMEKAWLDRFLALTQPRAQILDIGCGSGEPIARYFLARDCFVTGVDSSVELIEHCRRNFPSGDWRVADMRALAFDRTFDGLIAWDSFFHLTPDDQRLMFPVFRMLASSGAALLFTSGPAHGVALGEFEGEPLYHASLDGAEYRAALDQNGFKICEHVVEDPTCGGHTIWLAQAY